MATVVTETNLDDFEVAVNAGEVSENISEARQRYLDEVARDFISVRLSCNKLGTSKTEKGTLKEQFVEEINAESKMISIKKTLIDPKCPELQRCLQLEREVVEHWKRVSTPTPEPGYRIMRQGQYRDFCTYVAQKNRELRELAAALEEQLPIIKERSRAQLGQGYEEADYPQTVADKFYFQVFTHILSVPDNLEEELKQHEKRKIDSILELTVGAAEVAFVSGMQKVVDELINKLTPDETGKNKRFTDSTIKHILEFIEKFRVLNLRSNSDLEKLMDEAEEILGLDLDMANALRKEPDFRYEVKSRFEVIAEKLSSLVVIKPETFTVFEEGEIGFLE